MTNQATRKESNGKLDLFKSSGLNWVSETCIARAPVHRLRHIPAAFGKLWRPWLLIGVLAMTTVACGLLPVPVEPTLEQVTDTPVPMAEPTERPTAAPTDTVEPTETVVPTEAGDPFPAWWVDEMTQSESGVWWPPDEVVEMVKDHNLEAYRIWWQLPFETTPPDLDALEEAIPLWTSGPVLEEDMLNLEDMRAAIEEDRPPRAPLRKKVWQECYQHVECNEDGLTCKVGLTCFDGVVETYDPGTGEIIDTEHQDNSGIIIVLMRYDPNDGHWKVHEFLAWRELEE